MPQQVIILFRCSSCKKEQRVETEAGPDGGLRMDNTWPIGWLDVGSCILGVLGGVKDSYCIDCRLPVLKALGYDSYNSYLSVVKVLEERSIQVVVDPTVNRDAN